MSQITLKNFLKKYTAVSYKFIDEYYKFYEKCENSKFGINLEEVINYLKIKKKEKFYKRLRDNYKKYIDYITITDNKFKTSGIKTTNYYITLDTFEKICLLSHAKKANSVRDYFITLRKFIDYYKNNISEMISEKVKSGNKCIYIILVNKDKNIFKIGKASNIRERLKNYAVGDDKHPDIKFIMLIDNPEIIEKCAKGILKNLEFKERKEIYKVNIDFVKKTIINCVDIRKEKEFMENTDNNDAYIVFDDNSSSNINLPSKKSSKKSSNKSNKKGSNKSNKKGSKKLSNKSNKKGSNKSNKKGSNKSNKKGSKKGSKK
jgi:phage anti-repressor protein